MKILRAFYLSTGVLNQLRRRTHNIDESQYELRNDFDALERLSILSRSQTGYSLSSGFDLHFEETIKKPCKSDLQG